LNKGDLGGFENLRTEGIYGNGYMRRMTGFSGRIITFGDGEFSAGKVLIYREKGGRRNAFPPYGAHILAGR
jgi:hypothetical protein